jgi:2-hydroxy-3-keto-5-methylthiopentenyl-1-phosphate phosphatase
MLVVCDFDGTVTEKDNIIDIMREFAPPEWEILKDQVLEQKISIREGVGKMFSLIPSSKKEKIARFVLENLVIREGFREFVDWVEKEKIPFYIVSGGIDFFVYPALEGLVPRERIFCNHSDFSQETIQIVWPYSCDEQCSNDCGCCKPSILRRLNHSQFHTILIGDSITDLQAARLADHVFARDFLIEKCEEEKIPYTSFATFHDIRLALEKEEVYS